MSWLLMTFDEPLGPKEKWEAYKEERDGWWENFLEDSAWKEFRVLLDANLSSPIVYALIEFENLEDIHKLIHSERYREKINEFRAMGGTNLQVKIMKKSPVLPEPIRPEND